MSLDDAARLLIALLLVNWACTAVLGIAAIRHRWAALVERFVAGLVFAVIAAAGATLGLDRLGVITLPPGVPVAVLVAGLFLVSLPSVIWVVAYLTGQFEGQHASEDRIIAAIGEVKVEAERAYSEANHANRKLLEQNGLIAEVHERITAVEQEKP